MKRVFAGLLALLAPLSAPVFADVDLVDTSSVSFNVLTNVTATFFTETASGALAPVEFDSSVSASTVLGGSSMVLLQDGTSPGYNGVRIVDVTDGIYTDVYRVNGMATVNGRTVELPTQTMGPIDVRREVHVPTPIVMANDAFARHLTFLTNTSMAPEVVQVQVLSDIMTDRDVIATSDMDATAETTDLWAVTRSDFCCLNAVIGIAPMPAPTLDVREVGVSLADTLFFSVNNGDGVVDAGEGIYDVVMPPAAALLSPNAQIDGMAIDEANQWIYYIADVTGQIRRMDVDGMNDMLIFQTATTDLSGLAVDLTNSHAYYTSVLTDEVRCVGLDGMNDTLIDGTLIDPQGIAVDPANSLIFYAESGGTDVYSNGLAGGSQASIWSGTGPVDVDVDPANMHVYIADEGGDSLVRIDYDGMAEVEILGMITPTTSIALDIGDGHVFWGGGSGFDIGRGTMRVSNEPRFAHVFQGPVTAPTDGLETIMFARDDVASQWTYELTIPAGETQIIMSYISGHGTTAAAAADGARLTNLSNTMTVGNALDDMSAAELNQVRNFDVGVPVITRTGAATVQLECMTAYMDLGATVVDNFDAMLVVVIDFSAVDTTTVGDYVVTYNATDTAGNAAAQITRTVQVRDTIAPVISLTGADPLAHELGDAYMDPGATSFDVCDPMLAVVIDSSAVMINVDGDYVVTYNVTDASGNAATQVTRTVQVRDTTVPVITLMGADPFMVECQSVYMEPGATVMDMGSPALMAVIDSSAVDVTVPGDYIVTYNATDGDMNVAIEVTRTVQVRDTVAPVITRTGAAIVQLECGTAYMDLGATLFDVCDPGLAVVVDSSAVVAGTVGDYVVTYNATDASGNVAMQVTRTVEVRDTIAPVITRTGPAIVQVECPTPYVEMGATSFDACDPGLTVVVDNSAVIVTVPGDYVVTYNVTDGAGNVATQVTRTVQVRDTTPPVISIASNNPATVECMDPYVDAGASVSDACDLGVVLSPTATNVNTAVPGAYTVTYSATDASGNMTVAVRNVNVVDTIAPVITIIGDDLILVERSDSLSYVDAGANVFEVCDLTLTLDLVSGVDRSEVGVYEVTFNATDVSGNVATEQTRTVVVVDNGPGLLGAATAIEAQLDAFLVDIGGGDVSFAEGLITETDCDAPPAFFIGLLLAVAGGDNSRDDLLRAVTSEAYLANRARFDMDLLSGSFPGTDESEALNLFEYRELLAAYSVTGAGNYERLMAAIGSEFGPNVRNVGTEIIECTDGTCITVTAGTLARVPTPAQVYSATGDLDQDGVTNCEEFDPDIDIEDAINDALGPRERTGTGPGAGGGGGGCFIATAAYGTPLASEIDVLRSVRNEYMLTNVLGTAFTDTYYRLSPPIADVVAENELLRGIVRLVLAPLLWVLGAMTVNLSLALGAALTISAFVVRRRRNGRNRVSS